jgi:hypothetical protein
MQDFLQTHLSMFIIILTARHKGNPSDFAFEHIAPLFKRAAHLN